MKVELGEDVNRKLEAPMHRPGQPVPRAPFSVQEDPLREWSRMRKVEKRREKRREKKGEEKRKREE